jgi:5-methyltetrahydrofolate--homocysteine methyltransferase
MRKIKAPIMIDTTEPRSVELSLTYCQGKSIIKSINLEDGEEKFERICPIAREYGAVSAIVFHHPDCAYFSAAEESEPALA